MSERALSFGGAAAAYERFRPGYPAELVDAVLEYAGRPVATALEIGAGTGKATRAFAGRGIAVTATEPDPAMLAELRRRVPAVATINATFEQLPLDATYDLVLAAAAMHWTEPEGRWSRVAALLEPGGVFAAFGGPLDLADPEVETAVRAARAPYLPDDDAPAVDDLGLGRTDLLTDVRRLSIVRRPVMAAADYVSHLGTISAYLQLPDATRTTVLDAIRRVLPAQVALIGDLTVDLARRTTRLPA